LNGVPKDSGPARADREDQSPKNSFEKIAKKSLKLHRTEQDLIPLERAGAAKKGIAHGKTDLA